MGDCGNIAVEHGTDRVYLYGHSAGHRMPRVVRDALALKECWDDQQYFARIVFQKLVGADTGTSGYGISATIGDNEYPVLICDCRKEEVRVETKEGKLLRKFSMLEFSLLSGAELEWSVLRGDAR